MCWVMRCGCGLGVSGEPGRTTTVGASKGGLPGFRLAIDCSRPEHQPFVQSSLHHFWLSLHSWLVELALVAGRACARGGLTWDGSFVTTIQGNDIELTASGYCL